MNAGTQAPVGLVDAQGGGDLAITVCSEPGRDPSAWVQFSEFDFDMHDAAALRAVGELFLAAASDLVLALDGDA